MSQESSDPISPQSNKPLNASAKMTSGKKTRAPDPVDFIAAIQEFNQIIFDEAKKLPAPPLGEKEWAATITVVMTQTVTEKILPFAMADQALVVTKVNALHHLIEMAMGISYVPPGESSKLVLEGTVPDILIKGIISILESISDVDSKRLAGEKAFLEKVKELSRGGGECAVWKGLNEVLRLLD